MPKEISDAIKLYVLECIEEERKNNKTLFAIKLIETIVFSMLGFILLWILWALVNLIIKW
jgi:lipopolysaccharide/colanic/teichoic acid biosynthesis glycosyltransferase